MSRRAGASIVVLFLIAGCGSSTGSASTSPTAPSVATPATTASPSPAGEPSSAGNGGGNERFPGFEFERVRQVDPADLPDGIPVPVPFGGTVDEDLGASEGELLAIDYDPRFYNTLIAFYGTWLAMEGIDASPLVAIGGTAGGYEFVADGVPVRIEISVGESGPAKLAIFWG